MGKVDAQSLGKTLRDREHNQAGWRMGVTKNPTSQIPPILRAQDYGKSSFIPTLTFIFPPCFQPPSLSLCLSFLSTPPLFATPISPSFSPIFLPRLGQARNSHGSHPAHTFPALLYHQLWPPHFHRQRLNGCLAKNFFFVLFSLCELPGPQRHRGRLEMLEMLEMLLPWTFTRHILGSPLCFLSKKKKDLSALSKSAARLAALSCVTHEYLRAFFFPPSTFSFPSPLSFPLPILLVFNERKV